MIRYVKDVRVGVAANTPNLRTRGLDIRLAIERSHHCTLTRKFMGDRGPDSLRRPPSRWLRGLRASYPGLRSDLAWFGRLSGDCLLRDCNDCGARDSDDAADNHG